MYKLVIKLLTAGGANGSEPTKPAPKIFEPIN